MRAQELPVKFLLASSVFVDVLLVGARLRRRQLLGGSAAAEQHAPEERALAHRHTQQPARPAELLLRVRRVANTARASHARCVCSTLMRLNLTLIIEYVYEYLYEYYAIE